MLQITDKQIVGSELWARIHLHEGLHQETSADYEIATSQKKGLCEEDSRADEHHIQLVQVQFKA